jgi:hypothetical protein
MRSSCCRSLFCVVAAGLLLNPAFLQRAAAQSPAAPYVSLPPTIAFYSLLVGQSGSYNTLSLYNSGDASFDLSSATVTGDFQITQNACTAALAPQQSCYIALEFSPTAAGLRTGNLTLNDNMAPSPQTILLEGVGLTTAPAPTVSQILAVQQGGPTSQVLRVYGNNFLPNSTILWNGSPRQTLYQTSYELLGTLQTADIEHVGQATVTVNNPAPGGGTSAPAIATVYGIIPNLDITHEILETHSQTLYATISPSSPTYANSVIAINPVTMQVTGTLMTGGQPDAIAVSDDGTLLYVGLDSDYSVAQISIPSGKLNFTVTLPYPTGIGYSPANITASALKVVPGKAHTWVVGLCYTQEIPCGTGVAVYDDAVIRPTEAIANQLEADSFAFLSDPTMIYSLDDYYVRSFKITSSGITLTATSEPTARLGYLSLYPDGNLLYVNNGDVVNPSTLAVQSSYSVSSLLQSYTSTVDTPNHRLYFAGIPVPNYIFPAELAFVAIDQSSASTIGEIYFQLQLTGYGTSDVERFGTNGILIAHGPELISLQTSLVQAPVPTFSATAKPTALTFTAQIQGTSSAPKTVTLSNTGNSTLTITSIAASGNFSEANTCSSALAPNATCVVDVLFTPTATGTRTGTLTITDNATAGPQTVSLSGTGTAAGKLVFTPASLNFGNVDVGSVSPGQSVTITNGTGAVATVQGATGTTQVRVPSTTCGNSLPAGATCSFVLEFAPTTSGQQSGTILIHSSKGTVSFNYTGKGVAP